MSDSPSREAVDEPARPRLHELKLTFASARDNRSMYAEWFRNSPKGIVHASRILIEGPRVSLRFVADPMDDDLDTFVQDIHARSATDRITYGPVETAGGVAAFDAAWDEPFIGSARTPVAVAWEFFGPAIENTFSIEQHQATHRLLIPATADVDRYLKRLHAEVEKVGAALDDPRSMRVERFGPWIDPATTAGEHSRTIMLTAIALGYYDKPARASVSDISFHTGLPGNVVLRQLRELEKESFDRDTGQ